jgi:hypothetical protein
MDAEDRFLAYAAGQVAVLGLLAGVTGAMVLYTPYLFGLQHTYLAPGLSGPVATAAHRLLQFLFPAVLVAFLVVPFVAGVLALTGRDVLGISKNSLTAFALLLVFTTGAVTGSLAAGGASGTLVETRDGGVPQTAFAFDYEPTGDDRGVLTIRHDGGDDVAADRLVVQGEGIVDVAGANQTREGSWQGSTSGVEWRDERVVAQGDAVAVGVERDCVVRVVYELQGNIATLGKYTCPGADN